MVTVGVLVAVVAVLAFVFYWSGRYGDPKRSSGTSLHRGASAHTTRNGRPKKSYTSRDEAQAQARLMTKRDGAMMSAYKCGTCDKWHLGH
jgi:hypothetical protein